jgi:hypothetical protein
MILLRHRHVAIILFSLIIWAVFPSAVNAQLIDTIVLPRYAEWGLLYVPIQQPTDTIASPCDTSSTFISEEELYLFFSNLFFSNKLEETPFDSLFLEMEATGDSVVYDKIPFPITADDNLKLYEAIEQWYGAPYRRSGMTMKGTDCSGFVLSVYRDVYDMDLLRSSREMAKHILPIEKTELQEGDLIFFRTKNSKVINHVAIYLKEGYFVHASSSRGVVIDNLDRTYWKKYYYQSGRCFSTY